MTDTITSKVDALIASMGDLGPETTVHAAVARRLAGILDGDDLPLYAAGTTARALSAALAQLTGGVPVGRGFGGDLDDLLGARAWE